MRYKKINKLRGGAEVARQPHKLKVTGSSPVPATKTTSEVVEWKDFRYKEVV